MKKVVREAKEREKSVHNLLTFSLLSQKTFILLLKDTIPHSYTGLQPYNTLRELIFHQF